MTASAFYRRVYGPVVAAFAEMEMAGITIDVPYGQTLLHDLATRRDALAKESQGIAARYGLSHFRPTEKKRVAEMVYDKLGFEVSRRTETEQRPSVDATALFPFKGQHRFIDVMLEHDRLNKAISTNVDPFVLPYGKGGWLWPDGKIHSKFNLGIPRSGRSSSEDPNVQNIPARDQELAPKIRRLIVPSTKGGTIGERDYRAMELRVSTMYTDDRAFINVFSRNGNPHREFASEVLSIPQDRVSPQQYAAFKGSNFQLIFGGSWRGLQMGLGSKYGIDLSDQEAQLIWDGFFRLHPETLAYLERQKQAVLKHGYVESLTGRRREIPPPASGARGYERDHPFHVAANTPIQGTAWDILLGAILEFFNARRKYKLRSRQINAVHDSGWYDIVRGEESAVRDLSHRTMVELSHLFDFLTVPLDTEGKAGPSLGQMTVWN